MAEKYNVISYKEIAIAKRVLNEQLNAKTHKQGSFMPHRANVLSSGDTYRGYFKVIDASTPAEGETPAVAKIEIIDGYDETLPEVGFATINDTVFLVEVGELTITAMAFIYLQSVYNTETDTTEEPTFEQSVAFPTYEANKFKKLLCVVNFADSKITDIVQQHHDGAIIGQTFGDCE